jgi:hypothetical protein
VLEQTEAVFVEVINDAVEYKVMSCFFYKTFIRPRQQFLNQSLPFLALF